MSHCHTFTAVKWVPEEAVILCGIPYWWIQHSVSPLIVVLADSLQERKANPTHNEDLLLRGRTGPFRTGKETDKANLTLIGWLAFTGNNAILRAQW